MQTSGDRINDIDNRNIFLLGPWVTGACVVQPGPFGTEIKTVCI